MPPLLGGPVQLRAKVFSAATKASVTITRDRSGSLRRRANRTDRGGEPLARGDLAQGPGAGSATASPWPHSHDVCGRYRAASPPGKPARQLGYGVSQANALALQSRHERWAARWTPEGSGCDPAPDHRRHLEHAHFRTAGPRRRGDYGPRRSPEAAGRIVQEVTEIATSRSSRVAWRTSAHSPILGSFDRARGPFSRARSSA